MAKKHLLIPERLVNKVPAIRNISWGLDAFVIKSLFALLRSMSPERAATIAAAAFRLFAPLLPVANKIRGNLGVAFPDKTKDEIKQLTRATCTNLGFAAVELALAERLWDEREQRIEFVIADGVDLAEYSKRPAVLVSGHIGAWHVSTFIGKPFGVHITSVYAPEENPYLRDYFLKLRQKLPTDFISRDGCMRILTRELKRGNSVGLVSDTRMDSGTPLSFFGVMTPTNTTAARLAIRNKCEMFPVRAERLPDMKYRITLHPAIWPDDPDASVADQAAQMTQKLLNLFETWIREEPTEWMCFGRRWPHEVYADAASLIDNRR